MGLTVTATATVPIAAYGGCNADDIDQQRHRQDRSAAADQPEDQNARKRELAESVKKTGK
jgi:F0F1-type ATP synthase epsilon subunit